MRLRVVEPMPFADILAEALALTRRELALVLALDLSFVPFFVLSGSADPAAGGALETAIALALLGIALQTVGATATTHAMARAYLGQPVEIREAFARGAARAVPLFVTQVLGAIAAFLGFLLFILPGVYLSLAFLVVGPAVVLEGVAGARALGRSRALMRGHLLRSAALLAVTFVVFMLVGSVGLFLSALAPPLAEAIEVMLNAITAGYFTTVITIFYFDLRCRKEGYSGASPAPNAAPALPDPIA